jgi:hypothetical protein
MPRPPPAAPRRWRGWAPDTAGRRRRVRDARLQELRAWGAAHGFAVLGLHEDLAARWPVALLQGARSARAELAMSGPWDGRTATVVSALVRAEGAAGERVVQVVTLETGVRGRQAAAVWDGRTLAATRGELHPDVAGLVRGRALPAGDELAVADVELVHARLLDGSGGLDVEGPLALLRDWAEAAPPA